MGHDIVGQTQL